MQNEIPHNIHFNLSCSIFRLFTLPRRVNNPHCACICHWIGDSNRTIRDLVQGNPDRRAANEKVIQTRKEG